MRVPLRRVAIARSGDKGDTANVGLIALLPEIYPVLVREVTAERVQAHFAGICDGGVERYELPNLKALNFLLYRALDGGGTISLMLDAQGKTFGGALLRMEIDVPDELVARAGRVMASWAASVPESAPESAPEPVPEPRGGGEAEEEPGRRDV